MTLPDIGKARGRKVFDAIQARRPYIYYDCLAQASGVPATTWRRFSEEGLIMMPLDDLWDFRQHAESATSLVPQSLQSGVAQDDVDRMLRDLREQHERELENQQGRFADRLIELRTGLVKQMDEQREDLMIQMNNQREDLLLQLNTVQAAMDDLESNQSAVFDSCREKFENEQKDLVARHQQELSDCKQNCREELETMQRTLDGFKTKLCNQLQGWRERLDQSEQDKSDLEAKLSQEMRFRTGLQDDLEKLKAQHLVELDEVEARALLLSQELDALNSARSASRATVADDVEWMFADIMEAVGQPRPRRESVMSPPAFPDDEAASRPAKSPYLLKLEHVYPPDSMYSRSGPGASHPSDSLPQDVPHHGGRNRSSGPGLSGDSLQGGHVDGGMTGRPSGLGLPGEADQDERFGGMSGPADGLQAPRYSDVFYEHGLPGHGLQSAGSYSNVRQQGPFRQGGGSGRERHSSKDRASFVDDFYSSRMYDAYPNREPHREPHRTFDRSGASAASPDRVRRGSKKSGGGGSATSKKNLFLSDSGSGSDSDSSSVSSLELSPKKRRSGPPPPKMATFDGCAGKWKPFYLQFKLTAKQYKWDESTKRKRLLESLRGKAIEYIYAQSSSVRHDLKQLVKSLKQRFGDCEQRSMKRRLLSVARQGEEESLEDFADRLSSLVRDSYPHGEEKMLQEISVETFFRGCREKHAVMNAVDKSPKTLRAAVKMVRTTVGNQQAFLGKSYASRCVSFAFPQDEVPAARAVSIPPDNVDSTTQMRDMAAEIDALKRRLDQQDRSRSDSQDRSRASSSPARVLKCFTCNSTGHLNKDCPKKSQSPRTPPRSSPARVCYNCQGTGHFARECPERRASRSPSPGRSPRSTGSSGQLNN